MRRADFAATGHPALLLLVRDRLGSAVNEQGSLLHPSAFRALQPPANLLKSPAEHSKEKLQHFLLKSCCSVSSSSAAVAHFWEGEAFYGCVTMLLQTGVPGEPSDTHWWDSLIAQAAFQQPSCCTGRRWCRHRQDTAHRVPSTVPQGMVTSCLPLRDISELDTGRKLFLFPQSIKSRSAGAESACRYFPFKEQPRDLRCPVLLFGSVASQEAPVALAPPLFLHSPQPLYAPCRPLRPVPPTPATSLPGLSSGLLKNQAVSPDILVAYR